MTHNEILNENLIWLLVSSLYTYIALIEHIRSPHNPFGHKKFFNGTNSIETLGGFQQTITLLVAHNLITLCYQDQYIACFKQCDQTPT